MCVPGPVMTGISVIGSALGMAGSIAEQKAQREQIERQNAQNRENARIAQENAQKAILEGEKEKEKIRTEQKSLLAQKAVRYGAGNVSVTGGSALDVLGDMAESGERLAQDAGAKAREQAQGYERQAQNYYAQAGQAYNPFGFAKSMVSGVQSVSNAFSPKSSFQTAKASSKSGPNYF